MVVSCLISDQAFPVILEVSPLPHSSGKMQCSQFYGIIT